MFWFFYMRYYYPISNDDRRIYISWQHTLKTINCFYEYRTSRSMKNSDIWIFVNKCCNKLWLVIGGALLPISAIVYISFFKSTDNTYRCSLHCNFINSTIRYGVFYTVYRNVKICF